MANVLINVPQNTIDYWKDHKAEAEVLTVTDALLKGTVFPDNAAVVSFTPFEIKMLHMALQHQWVNMTDDNGQAVNCKQESANGIYNLLKKFEDLKAETGKEG